MAFHPQTGEPTIFVYDGYPGGAGIAELAFEAAERHARATLDLISACPCDEGCPCVKSGADAKAAAEAEAAQAQADQDAIDVTRLLTEV